jgi:hypothetical protein
MNGTTEEASLTVFQSSEREGYPGSSTRPAPRSTVLYNQLETDLWIESAVG